MTEVQAARFRHIEKWYCSHSRRQRFSEFLGRTGLISPEIADKLYDLWYGGEEMRNLYHIIVDDIWEKLKTDTYEMGKSSEVFLANKEEGSE